MTSLKPSLRKNYTNNVKSSDGKSIDEKARQMRTDMPKYKVSQKKICIEDILKDGNDLGSENIENELLDEILGKGRHKSKINNNNNNNKSKPPIQVSIHDGKTTRNLTKNISNSNNNNSSSSSLITSMASRLSALEKSHKKMRMELVQKEKECLKMKRKCQLLTKENANLRQLYQKETDSGEKNEEDDSSTSNNNKDRHYYEGKVAMEENNDTKIRYHGLPTISMADNIIDLESKNQRLRNQVHEMESFLKDYGLVWVGRNHGANNHVEAPKPQIDFAILFSRLDELNELAGAGKKVVQVKGKKAVFGRKEGIPLSVYKDGIMLFRGPFRPYTSDNARSFLNDVMDGYFPAEFKDKYPDGVVFEINDSSDKTYDDKMKAHEENESSSSNGFKAFGGIGKSCNSPKMKTQEFLNRLPEKIICGGEVIQIRQDIADRLAVTAENTKEDGTAEDSGNVLIPNFQEKNTMDFELRNNESRVARAARFAAIYEKRSNKK